MSAGLQQASATEAAPNYCAIVGPVYRNDALRALSDVHHLSAALHNALETDPVNLPAVAALCAALTDAQDRTGAAFAGYGAAISCKGVA